MQRRFVRSIVRVAAPFLALTLMGQGCLGGTPTGPTGPDGGVWKTSDRGLTWVNKRAFVQGPKVTAAAADFGIVSLTFDPQDPATIYAATTLNGLVYSLDSGDSWQQSKTLTAGRINAVAVDPKNKCTVYAASANKIYKTETCARDWAQIFFDPRTDKLFTQLAVDWFNPTIMYAASSDGDILQSRNAGQSWQTVKRIDGIAVTSIVIDPRDSRLVYVGTNGDGIWKTTDSGATWLQIKKQFGTDMTDARRATQVVLDPKSPKVVYEVSKFGIIRSDDQGETWHALNLTAPPGTIKITALAIDPTNPQKMVYVTPTTVTFTSDGGSSWAAKKLPSTRGGTALLIDPRNGDVIYLGTQPVKTQ